MDELHDGGRRFLCSRHWRPDSRTGTAEVEYAAAAAIAAAEMADKGNLAEVVPDMEGLVVD